jgi:YVTN family beta-propeller protein
LLRPIAVALVGLLLAQGPASPQRAAIALGAAEPTTTEPHAPIAQIFDQPPVDLLTEPANVYQATLSDLAPAVADIAPRVYVPNELSNSVTVIDPETLAVVGRIPVGASPQHITPSWDLTKLYVNDTGLTEIDPRTGAVVRRIPVQFPYNLYFTLDGSKAIVVDENLNRLDFYDPSAWRLLRSVSIPCAGIDHMDMSADGSYLLASCEFNGVLVKVDTNAMAIISTLVVGGFPVDVKLAPAGDVFFIANQATNGVSIIDPKSMKVVGFIGTGRGAHGFAFSRDTRSLYVSNRLAGTISVIDVATRTVRANWVVGGSPDMLTVSADGRQLWTGNRYASTVVVIDTATGKVVKSIAVEKAPHGLTFFPQPGRLSLGHNGVYR